MFSNGWEHVGTCWKQLQPSLMGVCSISHILEAKLHHVFSFRV